MIKEYIATGRTPEAALANAKAGLNAPAKFALEVKSEVLEMPRKRLLGLLGSAPAKARAYYDDGVKEKKPPKKQAASKAPAKKAAPKKDRAQAEERVRAPKRETAEVKREYPAQVDLDYAKQYLADIVKGLSVADAQIEASYKDGVVSMELACEDYGIIIGRRGETLDSIQYLISLAMKKHTNAYVRVAINVGNYREKRNETLRYLAQKHAAYVARTGRRFTFEPMNPYDRRLIHTAVQEIEGVESRSIGFNQDRRVVIEPVGGAVRPPRRDNGNHRRGGNGGRANATTSAPTDYTPKADRADLPKFGKIEISNEE